MTADQGGYGLGVLEKLIDPGARSRMVVREIDGIPLLEARLPEPFRVLFTTRLGGDSSGAFSSLNLDLRSDDDPMVVTKNRDRVAALLKRRLVSPGQVHGLRVVGAAEYLREPPGSPCDGLTLHPEIDRGLAALLVFADCVPLVLCGEVDMAVVHAGWRGILGGMVQQGGRAMISPPGTAIIGPSIGPCCFTVDQDVASAFTARFGSDVVAGVAGEESEGNTRYRVDLWEAVTKSLTELGVRREQVVNPRLCTACHSDIFYSYRKEGPVTGRQGCVGWVAA